MTGLEIQRGRVDSTLYQHRCLDSLPGASVSLDGAESRTSGAFQGLEKFDEGEDQAALGDRRAEQPFHKIGLHRLNGCFGFLPQGFDAGPGLRPQASGSVSMVVTARRVLDVGCWPGSRIPTRPFLV